MVERRKIAIFDLDGTLYDGPSLRHFFLFGVGCLVRKRRLVEAAKILTRFAAWKFAGIISHADMKYANCLVLEKYLTPADIERFVDNMESRINPKVHTLLDFCRAEGYLTVLATASPAFYCEPFSSRCGFDLCSSTPTTPARADYIENRGNEKLRTILELPGELSIVVTDHSDDLPLLKANTTGTNYLVDPSAKTLRQVHEAGVSYEKL